MLTPLMFDESQPPSPGLNAGAKSPDVASSVAGKPHYVLGDRPPRWGRAIPIAGAGFGRVRQEAT
jgi:hypothetical protein